jgi:hypothetical protein
LSSSVPDRRRPTSGDQTGGNVADFEIEPDGAGQRLACRLPPIEAPSRLCLVGFSQRIRLPA